MLNVHSVLYNYTVDITLLNTQQLWEFEAISVTAHFLDHWTTETTTLNPFQYMNYVSLILSGGLAIDRGSIEGVLQKIN
jgi:hypothetical protein